MLQKNETNKRLLYIDALNILACFGGFCFRYEQRMVLFRLLTGVVPLCGSCVFHDHRRDADELQREIYDERIF